jgi:hypothetical protein
MKPYYNSVTKSYTRKVYHILDVPSHYLVFESDGVRYTYRGSARLVAKYAGLVLFFDGKYWYRKRVFGTKKVALRP